MVPLVAWVRIRACALVLLAVLCVAAALAASPSGADAQRAHGAQLGGINIVGLNPGSTLAEADRSIAIARRLGATVVRTEVPWPTFEPLGPGLIDPRSLAFTDRLAADASAAGIRVIMTVDGTPCWASTAPGPVLAKCSVRRTTAANAWPPSNPAAYAAFAAFLARRYGAELAAIEVWNEPDQSNQHYFAGPNKAQRYAEILRAAYPAIKQANPNVTVLAGSLVGSNGLFLDALYAAGIQGYYDGLAVHYYNLVLGSLRSIHETQVAHGDSKPLWLDEFGWPSCWPRHRTEQEQPCVTPQAQAANVRDTVRSLARTPYVAAEVTYGLQDSSQEAFGVLSTRGARKPSFAAFSQAFGDPFGAISPVTLGLRTQGAHVLASGSGPVGDFMVLEAFQGSLLRYRALFTLDRFNRYALALPAVLGAGGLRVRVYQYWTGPDQDAQASI